MTKEELKEKSADLLITHIQGEVLRLEYAKSKRNKQKIRDSINKSYDQLIELVR